MWRISVYEDLNGIGAFRLGGRWNSRGHAVVYLAESPASALLEVLVHLDVDRLDMPDGYKLLRIEAPPEVDIAELNAPRVPEWQQDVTLSRQLGDAWLDRGAEAIARVPSALVPFTWNYLLNPVHPLSKMVSVAAVSTHLYDPRLLRRPGL